MNKHLAFEEREDDDNVLWVHNGWEGHWWTVDLETGAHNEAEPVAFTTTGNEGDTHGYSELTRCGFIGGGNEIDDERNVGDDH